MRVLTTHLEDDLGFTHCAPTRKPMRDSQSIKTWLLPETLLGSRKPSKTRVHTRESSCNGFVIVQLINLWLLSRCCPRLLRCMRGTSIRSCCWTVCCILRGPRMRSGSLAHGTLATLTLGHSKSSLPMLAFCSYCRAGAAFLLATWGAESFMSFLRGGTAQWVLVWSSTCAKAALCSCCSASFRCFFILRGLQLHVLAQQLLFLLLCWGQTWLLSLGGR